MQPETLILSIEIAFSLGAGAVAFLLYGSYDKSLSKWTVTPLDQRPELKKQLKFQRATTKLFAFLALMPIAIILRYLVPDPDGLVKWLPPAIMAALCGYCGSKIFETVKDGAGGTLSKELVIKFLLSGFFFMLLLLTLQVIMNEKEDQKVGPGTEKKHTELQDKLIEVAAKKLE